MLLPATFASETAGPSRVRAGEPQVATAATGSLRPTGTRPSPQRRHRVLY